MAGRSTRDALLLAVIGRPDTLPGPERSDLPAFWRRFDANAPFLVRAGLAIATVVIGRVLPRVMGHARGLASLNADEAERVVQRAHDSTVLRPLIDAATVVACMGYFDDDRIESAVRGVPQLGDSE